MAKPSTRASLCPLRQSFPPRLMEIRLNQRSGPLDQKHCRNFPFGQEERPLSGPVSPVPTPPKDSLVTSPRSPTYSVVTSPSPLAHSTAHPGVFANMVLRSPSLGCDPPIRPYVPFDASPHAPPSPVLPDESFPSHPTTVAPTISHAQEELLEVSSRRLARKMMASGRPP